MDLNLERLASYVTQRRTALGWTQAEVGANGGPSTTTLSKIEAGTAENVPAQTRRKLEVGLGWQPGSVHSILNGGEPVPVRSDGSIPAVQPEGSRDTVGSNRLGTETVEATSARLTREAEMAQVAFDQAVDQLLVAEAALDRANKAAFRAGLVAELWEKEEDRSLSRLRTVERSVTEADVALRIVDFALLIEHEWTRYERALVERFTPKRSDGLDFVPWRTRYMDMDAARASVSRIQASWTDEELAKFFPELMLTGTSVEAEDIVQLDARRRVEDPAPPLDAAAHSTGEPSAKERMIADQDADAERQDSV